MLIHNSMLADAHTRLDVVISSKLKEISARIDAKDDEFESELSGLYASETELVPASQFDHKEITWAEVWSALPTVVRETRVVIDNYRSTDRLSYRNDPSAEPGKILTVTAIVIGGNTLSRGLTLEGLCSSYFVRAASAYDTLLQMGRWFGYRVGYEDLCRVWMPLDLKKWFRDLSLVEAEIRQDMLRYQLENLSPSDVAVRIRTHPAMAITAAARMRHAIAVSMSFSGQRPQTTIFNSADKDWLMENIAATRDLFDKQVRSGRVEKSFPSGVRGFVDVDVADVFAFLDGYNFHPDKPSLQTSLLRNYIENENQAGSLHKWNLVVKESRHTSHVGIDLGFSTKVNPLSRTKIVDSAAGTANLRAIASPGDRALDMNSSPEHLKAALMDAFQEVSDETIGTFRQREFPTTGLIVVYPIDAKSKVGDGKTRLRTDLDAEADLIGLTFFFPRAVSDHSEVQYMSADLSSILTEDDSQELNYADDSDGDKLAQEDDANG
jgi:hypothetical protein